MQQERATALKVPPGRLGPVIAAVGFNLIPIVGVLFWGWSAFALIFLYWMENVVIGVRTMLSMVISGLVAKGMNPLGLLFFCGFFTVHYGIFCYAHGTFVVGMFGDDLLGGNGFDLVGAARTLFAQEANLRWGLVSIVLLQVLQLILFVVRGDAWKTDPLSLMASPYPRIIVLHLAIIFGGFLLLAMDEPMAGLVVLALVKTAFDVVEASGQAPLIRFDRRQPSPPPTHGPLQ